MAYAERCGKKWRARYKKPDGTWASEPGFETKNAAVEWGREQEGQIKRHTWIDPDDAETPFGDFCEQWIKTTRLAINTEAKYRSYLKNHILPQWEGWPLIVIFNNHLEIQGWVNELHDELAEPTVASIFALFSTIMNAAVRARKIPVSPCHGIRVTTGDYETERQVATPVQFLRAALRMYDLAGFQGFVLTLMNGYTGARWSELISQKPGQYDQVNHQIPVRRPIREARGQIEEAPRPKSPASRRWIQLPPFLAILYEALLEDCPRARVFAGARGAVLRRGNFTRRFWRPAWDGDPENRDPEKRVSSILTGFTFHEGRHSHRTWLSDDGISDIGRAARLGHRLPGMADVYEHLTPEMKRRTLNVLQARWESSVAQLAEAERQRLIAIVPPKLRESMTCEGRNGGVETSGSAQPKMISKISPDTA
ncbi:integrase [Actinoallomurus acanthiterrae]